jgi:hypothetical protein
VTGLKVLKVRINVSDEARGQRGWVKGPVDSDDTETNLDEYDGMFSFMLFAILTFLDWDYCFNNSKPGFEHGVNWVQSQIVPLIKTLL